MALKWWHWGLIATGGVALLASATKVAIGLRRRMIAEKSVYELVKGLTAKLGMLGGMLEEIPASWVMAIVKKESGYDANAIAKHPGDVARGGSYGLVQMSYATAKELGYTGPAPQPLPSGLLSELRKLHPTFPKDRGFWLKAENAGKTKQAIKLISDAIATGKWQPYKENEGLLDPKVSIALATKYMTNLAKRFGKDLKDVAAGYNSGRKFSEAPEVTREQYVPKVVAYAEGFKEKYG